MVILALMVMRFILRVFAAHFYLALPDLLRCTCLPRSIISLQDETACCNEMWFGRRGRVLPAAKLL
jgi:hypothetical protein